MLRILLAVCVLMIIASGCVSFKPTDQTVASDNTPQQVEPFAKDETNNTTGHWRQLQPEGDYWAERYDFQLRSHRGQLLLAGGQNTNGYLNDIWRSRNGSQWQQLCQKQSWQLFSLSLNWRQ